MLEAKDLYEQYLKMRCNHVHALYLLGIIEASLGNPFLARRLLNIAPVKSEIKTERSLDCTS